MQNNRIKTTYPMLSTVRKTVLNGRGGESNATKTSQKQATNGIIQQYTGQGGPGDTTMPTFNTSTSGNDTFLVRFSSDPDLGGPADTSTIWYVNPADKTMRPITSERALSDLYGGNLAMAKMAINDVTPSIIQPGGQYSSYTLLNQEYAIREGRIMKPLDVSPSTIANLYGQPHSDTAQSASAQMLDTWFAQLSDPNSGFGMNKTTVDAIKNDPYKVASYIGALTYGGYTVGDVWMDMKKTELKNAGDSSMDNYKVIDQNISKRDYVNTNPGMAAYSKVGSLMPGRVLSLVGAATSDASQLPDSFYSSMFPEKYDPTSPEFQAKMSEIKSALHDSVIASITARTEQERRAANYDWQNYKSQIERNYNIQLSDNALTAWGELQKLEDTMSAQGLEGSGIANEVQDTILRQARTQSDILRGNEQIEKESKDETYYKTSASPQEINDLIQKDYAKAQQWGLVPEGGSKNFSSFLSDFRSKYPEMASTSDAEIKDKYYSPLYDEYGNYRSTSYQTRADQAFQTIYGYNPNSIPATSLKEAQQAKVLDQATNEYNKDAIPSSSTANTKVATPVASPTDITVPTKTMSNADISKQIEAMTKQVNDLYKQAGITPTTSISTSQKTTPTAQPTSTPITASKATTTVTPKMTGIQTTTPVPTKATTPTQTKTSTVPSLFSNTTSSTIFPSLSSVVSSLTNPTQTSYTTPSTATKGKSIMDPSFWTK